MSIDAVIRWAEHVREELGAQSTLKVKSVHEFVDAPAAAPVVEEPVVGAPAADKPAA